MTMKKFSMVGKLVISGFLVLLFLMAISYQPVFAHDLERQKKMIAWEVALGFVNVGDGDWTPGGYGRMTLEAASKINYGLEVGYNSFKVNSGLNELNKKSYWVNANPTIRVTFGKSKLRPFISSGPGVYIPKEGKVRLGFKGGLGLEYQLSDNFLLEMGGDYHYIFLKENNVWGQSNDFFNVSVGIGITL